MLPSAKEGTRSLLKTRSKSILWN